MENWSMTAYLAAKTLRKPIKEVLDDLFSGKLEGYYDPELQCWSIPSNVVYGLKKSGWFKPKNKPPVYLSAAEAARRLKITSDHMLRILWEGLVPGATQDDTGKVWSVPEKWVEQQRFTQNIINAPAKPAQKDWLSTNPEYWIPTATLKGNPDFPYESFRAFMLKLKDSNTPLANEVGSTFFQVGANKAIYVSREFVKDFASLTESQIQDMMKGLE